MKKYILPAIAFLMTAGITSAQTTTKTGTDKSLAKTHKTTTTKKPVVNSSASSTATTATNKSTSSTTPIKRKSHKKAKSVPASK